MPRIPLSAVLLPLLAVACASPQAQNSVPVIPVARDIALPQPVTNNAVALLADEHGDWLFSFLGLGPGKTWSDPLSRGWQLAPGANNWSGLADVPGVSGRLAAAAVAAAGRVYVAGGYTVAADGAEKSIETLHAFDPETGRYQRMADMPVPVDDAVMFVWNNRWLYLVSGWHDTGNVNLVQVYDVQHDRWRQATPFPGAPVFGHAGGLVGSTIVICDGVKITVANAAKRVYQPSAACYRGQIDADDATRIDWYSMPAHPGAALYRMASTGFAARGLVVFAGGSDNPYNYNGVGYNGEPSQPSDLVFAWDVNASRWQVLGRLEVATMDHRALLLSGHELVIVGGMHAGQKVSADVLRFRLP